MVTEFEFDEDLVHLRDAVTQLCTKYSSEPAVRDAMVSESGYDRAFWERLGAELGVLGLDVAEDLGGAEAGLVVQALAVEELGAALVCGPVFGTLMLGTPLLSALPDSEGKKALLPAVTAGETTVACVVPSFGTRLTPSAVTVTAAVDGDGSRATLTGTAAQVVDGLAADVLLVAADDGSGIALLLVEAGAEGLHREALSTVDLTRRQARVTFAGTPATLLAGPEESEAAINHAIRVASVLLAAEQVGGSQRMLDTTVAYVKQRYQFGRPIGTFQAVKHRCADMLVAVEQARSAMFHAAWALQDGTDDAQLAVSLAQAVASETYLYVTSSAIQLHGGIGVTWEHPAHLYHKRALTDSLLLGRTDEHYELVGRSAVDHPAAH